MALQNGFVNQEQLLTAFRVWTTDKSRPLADILIQQKALRSSLREVLEALVDAHIADHGNSAEDSLSAVQSLTSGLSDQLRSINDADLESSLSGLMPGLDPCISLTMTMGETTTDCGRFQILRPYRQGGLGEVFVARDHELDREVALKQILNRRADDAEQRYRFLREAEITGKLEHPGIVPVYGLGEDEDGRPYYAMRFIRGRSLQEALEKFHEEDNAGKLDAAERNRQFRRLLGCFIDVCDAINYAHSRGVLHRDLKPNNVMLGRYGETLVVDWGLARVAGTDEAFGQESDELPVLSSLSGGSSETLDGTAVGTPAYMSPEQAQGRLDLLNSATDVYGLGATLYAIITGKRPFSGKAVDILPKVIAGAVPAARAVKPSASPALEAVCRKAMAVKREDRYQTPRDLAADIEAWLADEPVSACPEPRRDQIRRWTQRHQTAVTTAVAATLILAGSASIASFLLGSKNQELADANRTVLSRNTQLEKSQQATEEARKRADGVRDYLVAAFRRADPQQDGRFLTVVEVLQRSLAEMDEELADDDATRADLLSAIGESYQGLGLYQEMHDVFTREHALRLQLEPEDTEATLKAAYHLALATYYTGDYEGAIEQHTRNIQQQSQLLGDDHEATLKSRNGLAMALGAVGRYPESLQIYEEVLEKRKQLAGPTALATLMAVNNLATSYQSNGRLKEAEKLFSENLDNYRTHHGEDHLQTLMAMDRLASVRSALGNIEDAVRLYEVALEKRREKLGSDHPATVESIAGLGFAYREAARLEDARKLLEEALAIRRRTLGDEHPLTLSSMNDVARIYMSLGQYDEAIALAKDSSEKYESTLGDSNPGTLAALNTLGMVYFRQGHPESALPVFEKLLNLYIREYTDEHPTTNSMRNNLAMTYRNLGRLLEAQPLFETTLKWRQQELGDDHPKTLISMQNLASNLKSLGRLDEALTQAETALRSHRSKLGDAHRYTLSAMDILARSYLASGRQREAAPLAREMRQHAEDSLDSHHPDVAKGMDLVACVHQKSGELEDAVQLYRKTIKLRNEILEPQHPDTLATMVRLAEGLLDAEQDNVDEAVRLAGEAHEAALLRYGEYHLFVLRAGSVLASALARRGQGDLDRVDELFASSLQNQRMLLGEDHPETLKTAQLIAESWLARNDVERAGPVLQETLRRRTEKLGAAHTDTIRSSLALARCQLAEKKFSEAEELLQRTAMILEDLPMPPLPVERRQRTEMAQAFVQLYETTERPTEAAVWKRRLDE